MMVIMGFDTDTERTPLAIAEFIRASQAPINTVNIVESSVQLTIL